MKISYTYQRHEDIYFWRSRHGSNVELVVKQGGQLHPFNLAFHPRAAKPSRAFANTYGIHPQIIHPQNFLEYIGPVPE